MVKHQSIQNSKIKTKTNSIGILRLPKNILGNSQRYARPDQRPHRQHSSLLRSRPVQDTTRSLPENIEYARFLAGNVTLDGFDERRRVEWQHHSQAHAFQQNVLTELLERCVGV